MERFLKYIRPLALIVGILALVYLSAQAGEAGFGEAVHELSLPLILGASAFWLCNLAIAAERFRKMMNADIGYFRALEIYLASFVLNYASMVQGVGVAARVGMMKDEGVEPHKVLAGASGETIFDLAFTSLALVAFLFFAKEFEMMDDFAPLLRGTFIITTLLIVILLVLGRRGGFFGRYTDALKQTLSWISMPMNMIFTAAIWLTGAATLMLVYKACGAAVHFEVALASLCIGFVAGFISLVPGGLGVRDFVWAYVISLTGVGFALAAAAALLNRVLGFIIVFLVWGVLRLIGTANR